MSDKPQLMNESGALPIEHKVLVRPIEIEEKSSGGIILPKPIKEREEMAQVKALVVDVGSNTFSEFSESTGTFTPWPGRVPKPGDYVLMAKYAGTLFEGIDGKSYRIINDKEIVAILTAEK